MEPLIRALRFRKLFRVGRLSKGIDCIDGIIRTKEQDEDINLHVVSALGGPDGKAVLEYLKSITINSVLGPNSTDAELRHMEGMRSIVAILSSRIEAGHKQKGKG